MVSFGQCGSVLRVVIRRMWQRSFQLIIIRLCRRIGLCSFGISRHGPIGIIIPILIRKSFNLFIFRKLIYSRRFWCPSRVCVSVWLHKITTSHSLETDIFPLFFCTAELCNNNYTKHTTNSRATL